MTWPVYANSREECNLLIAFLKAYRVQVADAIQEAVQVGEDEELLKNVIEIDAELVNRLLFRYDNEAKFGVKEFRNALQAALITKETKDLREEYFQKGYQSGLYHAFEIASVEVYHEHKRGNLRPTDYWIGAAAIMNRLNKRITEAKGQSWSSVTPDPLEDE